MGRELTMDGVEQQIEQVLHIKPKNDLVQRLRSRIEGARHEHTGEVVEWIEPLCEEAANIIEDYQTLLKHERSRNEWAQKRIAELERELAWATKP